MKKRMLLGGTCYFRPVIETARKMDVYVITTGAYGEWMAVA